MRQGTRRVHRTLGNLVLALVMTGLDLSLALHAVLSRVLSQDLAKQEQSLSESLDSVLFKLSVARLRSTCGRRCNDPTNSLVSFPRTTVTS